MALMSTCDISKAAEDCRTPRRYRAQQKRSNFRQVFECGSPLPLSVTLRMWVLFIYLLVCGCPRVSASSGLHVGAAAVDLEADDSMIIAGGITAGKAAGQEGKLRVVAIVLEKAQTKLAIAACDILMITREHLDPVIKEIEHSMNIPAANILINCTHTHHAPSTMVLHGYGLDPIFTKRVQQAIVKAVQQANANISTNDCAFLFHVGQEETVGQNSRQLLDDGQIYWIGPRTNFVRATGPFDPELPVFAFRDEPANKIRAVIFNHSTHTIGTHSPGKRSPSFYGLAAQELENELGGIACYLEGASGSTHNLSLDCDEATRRIKTAVLDALESVQARPVTRLKALKRPFKFKVRNFDEKSEDEAVSRYCRKYAGAYGATVINVFRDMREHLAPQRGQERETWLQVLLIGDVAIAAVPGEFFTQLGLDIKNRSPFRYTYIAELANDWIGYLPNREAHKLGGYQVWTGYHSYAEPGTGERIVDEIVQMLLEVRRERLE